MTFESSSTPARREAAPPAYDARLSAEHTAAERIAREELEADLRRRETAGQIGPESGQAWRSRTAAQRAHAGLPTDGEFARAEFGLYRIAAGIVLRRYACDGLGSGAIDARWIDPNHARTLRTLRRAQFMAAHGLIEDRFGNMVSPQQAAANNALPDESEPDDDSLPAGGACAASAGAGSAQMGFSF